MMLARFAFMSRPYKLLRGLLVTRSRIPMVRLVPWGVAVVQERMGTRGTFLHEGRRTRGTALQVA